VKKSSSWVDVRRRFSGLEVAFAEEEPAKERDWVSGERASDIASMNGIIWVIRYSGDLDTVGGCLTRGV